MTRYWHIENEVRTLLYYGSVHRQIMRAVCREAPGILLFIHNRSAKMTAPDVQDRKGIKA
ncbi:hypothetical protein D3Z60_05980 [Lachnospiraceae bacterium]|nr:hypothetical protein [Lachnospiraceae bacterium]